MLEQASTTPGEVTRSQIALACYDVCSFNDAPQRRQKVASLEWPPAVQDGQERLSSSANSSFVTAEATMPVGITMIL